MYSHQREYRVHATSRMTAQATRAEQELPNTLTYLHRVHVPTYLLYAHQILHGDRLLRYGPIYKFREGDTLLTIAARFETTVKKLLLVNPHVGDGEIVQAGDGNACV